MNHQSITMADGSEWDLVIDHGRFVAIYPVDGSDGQALLAWHPTQTAPVPRSEWRVNDEFGARQDHSRAMSGR